MLCFVPVLHGCVWYVCCYVRKKALLGFGIGTMLAITHFLVRNVSPRGPMCFRCLIFSLSGPCELLFLLCFIASWTGEVVSVMLYPCMFCVALSIFPMFLI